VNSRGTEARRGEAARAKPCLRFCLALESARARGHFRITRGTARARASGMMIRASLRSVADTTMQGHEPSWTIHCAATRKSLSSSLAANSANADPPIVETTRARCIYFSYIVICRDSRAMPPLVNLLSDAALIDEQKDERNSGINIIARGWRGTRRKFARRTTTSNKNRRRLSLVSRLPSGELREGGGGEEGDGGGGGGGGGLGRIPISRYMHLRAIHGAFSFPFLL